MLAACSSNDKLDTGQVPDEPQPIAEAGAVSFDVYTNRTVSTRYGAGGVLNNEAIQKPWDQSTPGSETYGGFGVFGYYTDNNDYDQLAMPNFFYNQLVTYDNTNKYWSYDPVRYWPNEYGSSAISDDADRVSFFAYAPYVQVNPASGKPTDKNFGEATTGITQLSRNTTSGDPIVKYVSDFVETNAVDLCWGVNETNTWTLVNDGTQQQFTKGMPWIDVQRPREAAKQKEAAQRVKFTFKHALAQIKVKIDAFVDGYDNSNNVDEKTRIWVRSIRFNGFAMKGALNLNNENPYEPYWMNYNGVGDLEAEGDVIVYDGRRDGKEGMGNAEASSEKVLGLKPQFIQDEYQVTTDGSGNKVWLTNDTKTHLGVTKDQVDLFDAGGTFFVIPIPDEQVEVEIVYDVETIDPNLGTTISDGSTHGSSIENRISKTITFGSAATDKLEAGKAYQINLHLGMNSVKFDADVTDWIPMSSGTDVDLPANMPIYTAKATADDVKVNVALPGYEHALTATQDYYYFGVNGLLGGENVTAKPLATNPILTTLTVSSTGALLVAGTADNKANPSGIAYIKAERSKYYGVANKPGADDIVITSASGQKLTLRVALLAVKLGLTAPATPTKGSCDYNLTRQDGTQVLGWSNATVPVDFAAMTLSGYTPGTTNNNYIRVWLNGAELVKDDTAADGKFAFDASTGKLSVYSTGADGVTVAGDVIKVTIKAGDVAEETISFTISD